MPRFVPCLLLVATGLLLPLGARGRTDLLRQEVEAETFFLDDPAWVFGLRLALGYEIDGQAFPDLGLHVGRHFGSHLYLGAYVDGRLSAPQHLTAHARWGLRFARSRFAASTGTGVGVLSTFAPGDTGLSVAWWLDLQYRLRGPHSLLLFGQVDLLFRQLGFAETRQILRFGLGWELAF